ATALIAAGVSAVIADSVNATYLRNAINNGLLCLECPGLAAVLKGNADRHRDGGEAVLDLSRGTLAWAGRAFTLTRPPRFLMELIEAGGIEGWARRKLGNAEVLPC
ncbi:MAG: homoaconitase, partial [Planctomycetota bacterium]|nr:homoaconitase [Planctomycetota bacterium]